MNKLSWGEFRNTLDTTKDELLILRAHKKECNFHEDLKDHINGLISFTDRLKILYLALEELDKDNKVHLSSCGRDFTEHYDYLVFGGPEEIINKLTKRNILQEEIMRSDDVYDTHEDWF